MRTLSCSMWDLVSWPGIERRPPALGASKLFLLFCYWPEGAQEHLISFAFHSCSRTDDPHSFPAFNPGSLCVAWPRGGQQFLSLRGHLLDVSWRWQGGKKIDFRVRWIVALPLKSCVALRLSAVSVLLSDPHCLGNHHSPAQGYGGCYMVIDVLCV